MNKQRYNQHGEPITDGYYERKYQKEIDFIRFFKLLGFICGLILFGSFLIQIFTK